MRKHRTFIFFLLFVSGLFGSPVLAGEDEKSTNAELEDYALRGVLDNLGVIHFLYEGNIEELKKLAYVNLHSHIASLRKYEGNISDKKWHGSKIRALNAIGVMWDKHPPNKISYNVPEWWKIVEKNDAIIKWAMKECRNHPEYKCRSE